MKKTLSFSQSKVQSLDIHDMIMRIILLGSAALLIASGF